MIASGRWLFSVAASGAVWTPRPTSLRWLLARSRSGVDTAPYLAKPFSAAIWSSEFGRMNQQVGAMMAPGVQTEPLTIQYVGDRGQRQPIYLMRAAERPSEALEG